MKRTNDSQPLLSQLRRLACDHAVLARHEASKSFIYFAPWMEPFYPKGIGTFAADAFENYCSSLDKILQQATADDLKAWLRAFETFSQETKHTEEVRRVATSVPRNLGMFTPVELHDYLKRQAQQRRLSLNSLCSDLLSEGVASIRRVAMERGDAAATKMIAESRGILEVHYGNEGHKWVVALRPDVKARLSILAKELNTADAALATAILAHYVARGDHGNIVFLG